MAAGHSKGHLPALELLAGAVAGRPVGVAWLAPGAGPAWSDGERIFLSPEHARPELRREVLIQAALLKGGAFDPRLMVALVGRERLRERYLVLEVQRCCRALDRSLPAPLTAWLSHRHAGTVSASPRDSLAIARSLRLLPSAHPCYGTLKPLRIVRLNPAVTPGRPLTPEELQALERNSPDPDQEDRDDEDQLHHSRFWRLLASPLGKDGLLSRFLQEILDLRPSPGSTPASEGNAGSTETLASRLSSRLRDVASAILSTRRLRLADRDNALGGLRYPEWDGERQRWRNDWVTVTEVEPPAEPGAVDPACLRGDGRDLQRAMSRVGLVLQRRAGQPDGDELVLDRMIQLVADLRAGHQGDQRIHSAALRCRRDLAVQILLDASSSTFERSTDGRRVLDLQVEVAYQLCRALDLLGDRVALHGFHSWGRSLVRLQLLKDFEEPAGIRLDRRLRHLAVGGYTRVGAAVRHAVHRLESRAGTPRRLLVLISDGFAYDDEYEAAYGSADTRKAIEDARDRGIGCVCISIGGDADDRRLADLYGSANRLAVNRPAEVAGRLHALVTSALATAGTAASARTSASRCA